MRLIRFFTIILVLCANLNGQENPDRINEFVRIYSDSIPDGYFFSKLMPNPFSDAKICNNLGIPDTFYVKISVKDSLYTGDTIIIYEGILDPALYRIILRRIPGYSPSDDIPDGYYFLFFEIEAKSPPSKNKNVYRENYFRCRRKIALLH